MNTKLLNTLVVLMLVGTIACSSAFVSQLENIKNSELENNYRAQSIIDTVQLQLTTGQSVDNVVRLLQELIAGLKKQQKVHDHEHVVKNLAWKKLIKQYNSTIISLNAKILRVERQIQISLNHIKKDKRSIRINSAQIRLVSAKIKSLVAARKIDKAATKVRVQRQQEILKAVNYIIVELQKLLVSKSFVQLNQIKAQLQALVKENPIQALVQLTMTFSPSSVNFAAKKLGEIRSALVASLKDEEVQEAQARRQFVALKAELESFLHKAHLDLDANRASLAAHRKELAAQQKDLKLTQALLKLNQKLLADTIAVRKAYNILYQQQKVERKKEIVVLNKVINILNKDKVNTNAAEASKFTAALKE